MTTVTYFLYVYVCGNQPPCRQLDITIGKESEKIMSNEASTLREKVQRMNVVTPHPATYHNRDTIHKHPSQVHDKESIIRRVDDSFCILDEKYMRSPTYSLDLYSLRASKLCHN
jgi:hypothetical protein